MKRDNYNSRFLFVYGTLREGHGAAYKIETQGGIFVCTNAKARGKRLGGIVATFDNTKDDWLDGHLVLLPEDDKALMNILDRYEGVNDKNPDEGMYKRVLAEVLIPGHDFTIDAWAYHCNIEERTK